MAATQAENQQNDVNSEKVQSDQHLNVRNTLLQNGTDKSIVRGGGGIGIVHTKAKNSAGKNIAIEMSQYRQDSGGGGSTTVPGQTNTSSGPTSSNEPNLGVESEPSAGSTATATDSSIYSTEGPAAPSPAATDGHAYGFPYGRDLHNSSEGGLHAFGPRQPFGAPKQMPPHQPHQRFVTGPSISQTPGPTPTLNQLLQSNNNTMPHRYPNNYGHPDQHYNQSWPPQKPLQQAYTSGPPGSAQAPVGTPPSGSYRTQPTLSPAYGGGSAASPGYSEGRSNWSSGPQGPGGHGPGPGPGPGSPGQANSSAPVSQPSPQPSQPPSHSPGPGPGMPPSPQHQSHQGFPSRPAPPTTPNAHGPDAADLSGGNSNDSSGGPAPGTPNSQGMRPTPSPTGSTGSRSMSPAVGQNIPPMPPRPSSGQSDGNGPSRISHSPMVTQGSYPTSHSSPHPSHGYKGHPSMVVSGSGNQQMPLYQPNQYPQTGYPPRPPSNIQYPGQGYGPPTSQTPPNNMPPQQFPGRSAPNHMQNSQFPPYQQSWQSSMSTSSKGNGPNTTTQAPASQSPGSTPRPPHYLKHHLQHKMGFQNVPGPTTPSASPPQNYHMGPPSGHHHSGMGPPPSMGPPNMPPGSNLLPNNHPHEGPMPPPSSTPNSHTQMVSDMMDNGITTTAQGGLNTHVTTASGGSVTSVVTTGPDGTPIDEGSQQSTLSNASAASGEDPQCTTPKASRKNDMSLYSHPTTPQNTVPSPGAASINSMHEEYGELGSPSWPRTPASPVFNSHVPPPETYRSKKTDSLSKLYEMDENPERKAWLDKLLAFMDDRRTPITTCPTISKNPLDLFRLYMFVKDRGGFMEVTKNKTWKDIAGLLGIGASSSAAYTLRKHYTKNLLAYECQFDRGGIDPQPIINQVEATSKKKSAKATSVPSPGSSNSQDSFPTGSGAASMDGYSTYGGYPPSGNPDYPPQRPSSQSAPSPHGGVNHLNSATPGGPSPASGAADNVSVSNPFDDVSPSPPPRGGPFSGGPHPSYPSGTPPRPSGQNYSGQPGYQYPGPGPGSGAPPDQYSPYPSGSGYPPSVRPVYPPYSGGDSSAPPQSPNNAQGPPSSVAQDPYRYNTTQGSGYNPRPAYGQAPSNSGPPTSQSAGPGNYAPHPDYYRQEQVQQGTGSGTGYTGGTNSNKNMPPPGPQPPRRHPDFAKDQPYTYGQPRTPMYSGWPNNTQYRPPQYGGTQSSGPQVTPQQWSQSGRPAGPWPANQNYQQPQQGPQQPPWQGIAQPTGQNANVRPPVHRPGKPFSNIMTSGGGKGNQAPPSASNTYSHSQMPKREIIFPPDSVEATVPLIYRRRRICKNDVNQVDAWRIIMCLRSGLLSETTYAIDMLNILLFDDLTIGYFGLYQWPGLLDLLMEHFKRSLSDMFDGPFPREEQSVEEEIDLGGVSKPIDPNLKTTILTETPNYSFLSRKGHPVKLVDRDEDIFVQDHVKDWDTKGDPNRANILAEIPTDPWYTSADHILPTFQAEFGRIPFHMSLDHIVVVKSEEDKREPLERKIKTPPPDETPPDEAPPPAKACEKRRRTKTLSDVISRIKKDSEASDMLTLETTDKIKTEVVSEEANCEESPSIDLNISVNGECGDTKEPAVRDPSSTLKRRRISDYEDEAYTRDEASLVLLTESQDNIGKRCLCLSNILRSLTFIPGNELEFARSGQFLALIGKLLLLHHEHPPRTQKTRNYDREDADFADSCSSLQGEGEWWWEFLIQIRENILVSISNIAGQIDVSLFEEEVARPLLDGLLHWAICPSASGQDPFASVASSSLLSPQRLALEALCKLCVTNSNVDLVIATPPFSRLERLCAVLTKHLCKSEDQVLREFSINLLHYLAAADSQMARVVAKQTPCVSLLVAFIEQAEQSAMNVANAHGISALRENPDSMGTSLDMLRRAAATLVFLARHPDNHTLMVQQEPRLLALVMSQILDQQVALLLAKVLYQISHS
ncbi:trithorax group protein osa isoform X2 [Diabrotica virgifera virgifera]|uniref:ARID domain-containing protein n=1 Tax=Diabrotica virgifera virgifera TaxID=50390 RepID=A0ABM5LA17_DIAVI|nr:trithorax group protein osa isoform X2 [Diabrotica virgifera virgifera]